MGSWFRAAALVLIAPLALAACVFAPGKFESTLDVRADRSFAFAYRGEVLAIDLSGTMGKMFSGLAAMGATPSEAGAGETPAAEATPAADPTPTPEEIAEADAKYRALAEKLSKEAGYNKVEYRGEGIFYVDYAIRGTLTHGFVFPYNQDAELVLPWVAIELRGRDVVRVKAPGFAKQDGGSGGMGAMGATPPESRIDGVFTLVTDAVVVSQSNEEGGATAGGVTTVRWKVDPQTETAPSAVLRVRPL